MTYILLAVALYLISILWIGYIDPFLQEGIERVKRDDAARQAEWERRRLEQIREEEGRLRPPEPEKPKEKKVGDFLKFAFPIIRRASPALVAPNLVSVQPMTAPVGGIAFYRAQYAQEELRTVLDDIVDALNEDDELDLTDADRRCQRIADEIVREVFKDCPYSNYYTKDVPDIKGPPVMVPAAKLPEPAPRKPLRRQVERLLLEREAAARSLLSQESVLPRYLQKWSPLLNGESAKLLEGHLRSLFDQSGIPE